METIAEAWHCPWQEQQVDAFRVLDLQVTQHGQSAKRWSAKQVGSIRLQLAIAKKLVLRFNTAQESRQLAPHERSLQNKMKLHCLGLASAMRTIMRQRSRITYLAEGDANTKFFHLQACHRNKESHINSIKVDDMEIVHDQAKAEVITKHFQDILGNTAPDSVSLDFSRLSVPTSNLSSLDRCFSKEEIWETIKELPSDRTPGPDGFTGLFYKTAWLIIKNDIMRAFDALWSLDGRSLYLVNQAYMILLKKKKDAS